MRFVSKKDRLLTERYFAKKKWCLLPRKCIMSEKTIWFKQAYRISIRQEVGFDEGMYGYYYFGWIDKHEYLKLRLMS